MGVCRKSMRIAVLAGAVIGLAPAAADAPDPLWRGVARLGVHCLVTSDRGVDGGDLHRTVCERVRAIASEGAPMPVTVLGLGDRGLFAQDGVTLLVHATLEREGARPTLAFSIRPHRNDAIMAEMLFGTPPRAVPFDGDIAAFDRAVAEALDLTLPWRRPADRRLPHDLQPDA